VGIYGVGASKFNYVSSRRMLTSAIVCVELTAIVVSVVVALVVVIALSVGVFIYR